MLMYTIYLHINKQGIYFIYIIDSILLYTMYNMYLYIIIYMNITYKICINL